MWVKVSLQWGERIGIIWQQLGSLAAQPFQCCIILPCWQQAIFGCAQIGAKLPKQASINVLPVTFFIAGGKPLKRPFDDLLLCCRDGGDQLRLQADFPGEWKRLLASGTRIARSI
jgi:hypothetical protein